VIHLIAGLFCDYIPEEQVYSYKARHKRYITDDLYSIANRLKEIDDGYFVLFNTISGTYEVHNRNNIGDTFCFTGYEELDYRTLFKARETDVSRSDQLIAELEQRNDRLEKQAEKEMRNNIEGLAWDELANPIVKGRQYFV